MLCLFQKLQHSYGYYDPCKILSLIAEAFVGDSFIACGINF